jgi:hypothetical protein
VSRPRTAVDPHTVPTAEEVRDLQSSALSFNRPPTRQRRLILAVGAAILAVVIIVVIVAPAAVTRQFALSFTRRPVPFSALSVNAQELPRLMRTDRPNTVVFQLTNHETHAIRYAYTITLLTRGRPVESHSGEVKLNSGQSMRLAQTIVPPAQNTQYVVSVTLSGRPEQIHFSTRTAA